VFFIIRFQNHFSIDFLGTQISFYNKKLIWPASAGEGAETRVYEEVGGYQATGECAGGREWI